MHRAAWPSADELAGVAGDAGDRRRRGRRCSPASARPRARPRCRCAPRSPRPSCPAAAEALARVEQAAGDLAAAGRVADLRFEPADGPLAGRRHPRRRRLTEPASAGTGSPGGVPGSSARADRVDPPDRRRPTRRVGRPGSFGVIDVAGQSPQHDGEGRSATILPGVPLPDWALPAGPIAPEPEPELAEAPAAPVLEAPVPAAGARRPSARRPAVERSVSEDTVAMAPLAAPPDDRPARAVAVRRPRCPSVPTAPGRCAPVGLPRQRLPRAGARRGRGRGRRVEAASRHAAEAAEAPPLPSHRRTRARRRHPTPRSTRRSPTPTHRPVEASTDAPRSADDRPRSPDAALDAHEPTDAVDQDEEHAEGTDGDAAGSSRRTLALLGGLGAVVVLGAVAAFVWPGLLVTPGPEPAPVGAAGGRPCGSPAACRGRAQHPDQRRPLLRSSPARPTRR